jgi:hypothetical protein
MPTRRHFFATALGSSAALGLPAQEPAKPFRFPKCQILPEMPHQAAFQLGGRETLRWQFSQDYPRPCFFPFKGPSGISLTRMGHPGAPNHDHHQSVWFAHNDVSGCTFWANNPGSGRIRQKDWLCYEESDEHALMAVSLGWYDGKTQREVLDHTLIAIHRPGEGGEHTLELQSTFKAPAQPVQLGKTNFGFLAVRVAKSISVHFGGGLLTDSEGRVGEESIFGKQAVWMDYSGPIAEGITEGITFHDHPANPRHPARWHVRSDGWMGAAFCLDEGFLIEPAKPLQLRYLLHAHRGPADAARAAQHQAAFARWPLFEVIKSTGKHRQFETRAVQ